jgi:hypothetical protein
MQFGVGTLNVIFNLNIGYLSGHHVHLKIKYDTISPCNDLSLKSCTYVICAMIQLMMLSHWINIGNLKLNYLYLINHRILINNLRLGDSHLMSHVMNAFVN